MSDYDFDAKELSETIARNLEVCLDTPAWYYKLQNTQSLLGQGCYRYHRTHRDDQSVLPSDKCLY